MIRTWAPQRGEKGSMAGGHRGGTVVAIVFPEGAKYALRA